MPQEFEKLQRLAVPALDEMLGAQIPILDDGFIRIIDYFGSDESIVQAARVSYGRGTKRIHEDRGLIRYLMRHRHTTPFEMCEIKLHVRVPMDAWRQWIRHRTANINEYSTRYSVAIDATQRTAASEWRLQASGNRQGSEGTLAPEVGLHYTEQEQELQDMSRRVYNERVEKGIAREQARKDLPLSTYTEAYWKIDLHNLLHFLELRMDQSAQYEIRCYANAIGQQVVKVWCPLVWEAFVDYRLNALSLTRLDIEIIRAINARRPEEACQLARGHGWLEEDHGKLRPNRERSETEAKLRHLKLPVPWAHA